MIRAPMKALIRLCAAACIFSLPPLWSQGSSVGKIQEEIRRGDYIGALRDCDSVLKLSPNDHQVWTLKGIALQLQGQGAEAQQAMRRALALQPNFLPALEGLAQIQYRRGDPESRRTLEQLLAVKPDLTTAHAMLAALAFERKDCEQTVDHAAKALTETMANTLAREQYATCLFRLKRFEAAENLFREQLNARESDEARFNLGLAQFESKKFAEAVGTLKVLGTRNVPDSAALSLLASAYEANGQTPESLQTLRQAIDVYPREERHYIDLAAICLERNAFSVGIEVLKIGEKNIPRSAKIQVMAGVLQARAGKMEEAEQAFRRAESLDPNSAYGRVGLAAALLQFNAVDEAIGLMRDQHKRDPGDARVASLLAQAILQKGNGPQELKEARSLLTEAVKSAPQDARSHGLLGKVLLLQQEFEKAVPELEAAIRLDPNDRTATYQLMTVYRRLGKTREIPRLQQKVRELLDAERTQESEGGRYRLAINEDEATRK